MVLDGMTAALGNHALLTVAATASSLKEGLRGLADHQVDVVVTDLELGDGLGTELVAAAAKLDPPPAVLLITGTDDRRGVSEALAAGCAGFVSKGQGFDRLVDAVHSVANGAAVFPAELLGESLGVRADSRSNALSEREREVLQLLAVARTAKDIADELYLSEHTVRNHIRQVLAKLEARSQLEAVVIGARLGIVAIG